MERSGPYDPSVPRLPIAFVTALLVVLGGCGGSDSKTTFSIPAGTGSTVSGPVKRVIDERHGLYLGVGIGGTQASVVRVLGPPVAIANHGGSEPWPIGRTFNQNFHPGGPGACRVDEQRFDTKIRELNRTKAEPPFRALRYASSSFIFGLGGGICDVQVVQSRAGTRRGVAIGDPLAKARQKYPSIGCHRHRYYTDEGVAQIDFPFCTFEVAPDRYLYFGGDPIDTIEMSTSKLS